MPLLRGGSLFGAPGLCLALSALLAGGSAAFSAETSTVAAESETGQPGPSGAQPPPPAASPSSAANAPAAQAQQFKENHLLGDWGGLRSSLWEKGIQAEVLLITDPYGNPSGGLERGFTTYSMVSADLKVDTGKTLGLKGGQFHVGFAVNFGTQLSQDVVGNTFPIQSSDVAPPGPRLTTLSYSQSLFDDRLNVRLGRLSIDSLYGEEFAASSYFRQFTSVAFNAIPFAIFYNAPGALGYPATTWGARARYRPAGDVYVMAGLYNADPAVGEASVHGLDFTFRGPAFGIGEIGWMRNQGPQATGLPGNLKLGGFVLGGSVPAYDSTQTRGGRHGFYLVGDQALTRLGAKAEGRQLGVFGSLVTAPDEAVSPMPLFFSTGLVVNGPFASRPKDVLALGVAYGGYSAALRRQQQAEALLDAAIRPQVSELTIELSYALQLLPGLTLQPGVQYLIRPGGSPATSNALALGVNAVVSF
ncbi:carbohydrate porin [Vulcanococcus limneticus]|uniref:carbohydrate porin n=1 Tax=Vulcanococcus limneticus TaxID=2170428 RepID=UPI00398C0266